MDPLLSFTSAPKRRPISSSSTLARNPCIPVGLASMECLLETLLGSCGSPECSLERIVDSRVSEHEKTEVIDNVMRLGLVMVESALKSRRKLASKHNTETWPLPPELTVKVFSMLDTRSQCYVAATCSLFNKFASDPMCYADINLTSISPRVNTSLVYTMIQRAGKNLRSIKLGRRSNQLHDLCISLGDYVINQIDVSYPLCNEKKSRWGKESSGLTRSCLHALCLDGGASGALLRSLHLYNIERMDNSSLCEVLSACCSLVELEIIGLNVELRTTLECLSTNCHLLEQFSFESSKTGRDDSLKSETCIKLVNGCPSLTTLALRGFKLHDHKIRIFAKGFRKLRSLDFSMSYSFTGAFLRFGRQLQVLEIKKNFLGITNCLEVLVLRDCLHLRKVEVTQFLSACLSGDCMSLTYMDVSNRDGLSSEEDWYHRSYNLCDDLLCRIQEERPHMRLVAVFPSEKSMFDTDELEEEVNSDISSPSQMSLDSTSTSGSSDSSEQVSGNEEGENVIYWEASD